MLLSFTGIKSTGTILGSHEWQLEKLENFAITFWEKPTFNFFFPASEALKKGPNFGFLALKHA